MSYLILFIVLCFLISCEASKRSRKQFRGRRRDKVRPTRRSTSSKGGNSMSLSDWTPAMERGRTRETSDYSTEETGIFNKVYRRADRLSRRTRQRRHSPGRSRGRGRRRDPKRDRNSDRRHYGRGGAVDAEFPFSPSFQAMVQNAQNMQAQRRHRRRS